MLQKLPKTEGDSVRLGTLVAVGVCPSNDKSGYTRFATFDLNNDAISYEMINVNMFDRFIKILKNYSNKDLGIREDLRFVKTKLGCQIHDQSHMIDEFNY